MTTQSINLNIGDGQLRLSLFERVFVYAHVLHSAKRMIYLCYTSISIHWCGCSARVGTASTGENRIMKHTCTRPRHANASIQTVRLESMFDESVPEIELSVRVAGISSISDFLPYSSFRASLTWLTLGWIVDSPAMNMRKCHFQFHWRIAVFEKDGNRLSQEIERAV